MIRPNLLTLGHGYSAAALAASLPPDWTVTGTTRSAGNFEPMRRDGVTPLDWADRAAVDGAIRSASQILVSIPPNESGDPVLARHIDALRASQVGWIGYLSTTGVYGDRGGDWVDEDTPVRPVSERSRRRVEAERAWLESGVPVHIFRLASIYGPGRNALERVRAGQARRIVKPGQVFSRVHCDDVAQALTASMKSPAPGRIYNLADDAPAPPQEVVKFAAGLLGVDPPDEIPFSQADLSPMVRSFYGESKRVSNGRVKEELGVRLLYPGYREGLLAILEAES